MLQDIVAQANALRAMYGDAHGTPMPASFTVHLFTEDPDNGGVELAQVGGYAPKTATNNTATFPVPDAGATLTTADFIWTSTGAWSDVATWAELRDGTTRYNGAPLGRPVDVTEAGTEVRVNGRIFFNQFAGE